MDNWVGGCHFYRIMRAWGQHPELGEVWGAGNVSEGRQLVMIKKIGRPGLKRNLSLRDFRQIPSQGKKCRSKKGGEGVGFQLLQLQSLVPGWRICDLLNNLFTICDQEPGQIALFRHVVWISSRLKMSL